MKHFTVRQFKDACHARYFGPEEALDQELSGVETDSRGVTKGTLFVAIPGERVDGHKFIPDVYAKGAACALSQQELTDPAGPYLLVEDTQQALKEAAESYRQTLGIPVIGITGSVGKTSTKEMVASILSQKYNVLKTQGNFNNELGVPLTIFRIGEEHEVAVVEMGMNHYGEMHRLSKMVRPTHCLFTNIGVAHLEFLGSRDGILKAKCEMFDYAADDVKAFVNGDDDKLITLKDIARTFGMDPSRDVWADSVEKLGFDGVRCRIHTDTKNSFETVIPLPGTVVPHPRQGQQVLVGVRKPAALLRHDPGGLLQVPGPAVIAQALPQLHQPLLRGGCQSLHRGECLQKAGIIPQHRRYPGLLQHDLRDPDLIRVCGPPPGQVPGIGPIPRQQRPRQIL